tara:strand:- start:261 stop:2030 length:1770 start_codon:yes stop_codon:yes gene_type:complete
MLVLWACVLIVPFLIPAHFYPLPTYPEELVTTILVVGFGIAGVFSTKRRVYVSNLMMLWLVAGIIWYISWFFNKKEVVSGALFYQIFWVVGFFALIGSSALIARIGKQQFSTLSARVLVFSGFLYAMTGLFTYYGGLKFIIPWISVDQSRLVGFMGHPNLSGLYLAISLSAFGFALSKKINRPLQLQSIVFVLIVTLAGVLTGSRAFFVILIAQCLFGAAWYFLLRGGMASSRACVKAPFFYQLFVLGLSGILFVAYPPTDRIISESLAEHEILNRQSTSEMLMGRYQAAGQPRLGEWRKIVQGIEVIPNIWLGVGPGSYPEFSVAADEVIDNPYRNGKTWRNAHNIFLMAFVEWGIIGCIFVFSLFSYIFYLFVKSEKSPENYFIWLSLTAIIIHNLVEFSLWHMQFLIVFLVLLTSQVKIYALRLTSPSLRWVSVVPVVILTIWMSFMTSLDYARMVYLFSKPEIGAEDIRTLDLVAQNSLWRPYSRLVMYYRLNPIATGIEGQLNEATAIAHWSPLNLVLMRQASLTAAVGESALACKRINRATELYPSIAATLDEELVYLNSQNLPVMLGEMRACFKMIDDPKGG